MQSKRSKNWVCFCMKDSWGTFVCTDWTSLDKPWSDTVQIVAQGQDQKPNVKYHLYIYIQYNHARRMPVACIRCWNDSILAPWYHLPLHLERQIFTRNGQAFNASTQEFAETFRVFDILYKYLECWGSLGWCWIV